MFKVITNVLTTVCDHDIHKVMKTNVMALKQMTSAASAARSTVEESPAEHCYDFNAANGEPEGCEFAESHEAAAREWGECLQNGDTRLMCVWGPGHDARWFRIERTRDGVDARECRV